MNRFEERAKGVLEGFMLLGGVLLALDWVGRDVATDTLENALVITLPLTLVFRGLLALAPKEN